MAGLNDNDLKRIDARIGAATVLLEEKLNAAIAALSPKGWKRAANVLREFGAIATIITVFVALLAIALGAVYQSFAHVKEETQFRTRAEDRLAAIETSLLALRASRASATPTDRKSQAEAKDVLATAKKSLLRLPATVVEETGSSFIRAASDDAKVWDVALEFVGYRSSLNGPPKEPPSMWNRSIKKGKTEYELSGISGKPEPEMFWINLVPQGQAARAEQIRGKIEQTAEFGAGIFVMNGGTVSLDGMYLRHVVIQGVEVHYSGKAAILEDVSFVNCRFIMDNTPNTRTIGEQILASDRVSLRLQPEPA
jgi:hypothetical protein